MEDLISEKDQSTNTARQDLRRIIWNHHRKWITISIIFCISIAVVMVIFIGLAPVGLTVSGNAKIVTVEIVPGQSFSDVVATLMAAHLLRSRLAFEFVAVLSGIAFHVQSGIYHFSPTMSASTILHNLSSGVPPVTVVIPEGSNIYEIDKLLADAGIIGRGDLINFKGDGDLEGKLFPDTYQFFEGSSVPIVIQKFLNNFNQKALPLFAANLQNEEQDLTLASIVEKEASDPQDQNIIAGIILKRLADGMRLQIDATVCYAKQITLPSDIVDCSALTHVDFSPNSSYDSKYNTYLYAGLPPGPIGNPGIVAIMAALHPASSPFWYYMSDPATGKVVYAITLAEQEANIKKYLGD